MKKLMTVFSILVCLALSGPSMATLYTADLGATDVLSGVTLGLDWGEVEPDTSGGNYGGFGSGNDYYVSPTTATADYDCKMVWGNTASGDTTDFATATFDTAITSITIRHLDGSSTDSFNVYVGDGMGAGEDDILWGTYAARATGKTYTEQWFETTFTLPVGTAPGTVLTIDCTAPAGTYQSDYGQLGIDRFVATAVPEPATLAILGLGALFLRKRKA